MKTNVWLEIEHDGRAERCRVKLDSRKFPYVIIDNEKIIIAKTTFPYTARVVYGLKEILVNLISGQEELEAILANPDLTADRLSVQEYMRIA